MPHPSPFDIDVRRAGDIARVALRGELDLATAPRVEETLAQLAPDEALSTIVVDLRELQFLDSTGLRVLIQADAQARRDGQVLTIVRGPARISRLFAIAGIEEHLRLVDEPPGGSP